MTTDERRLELLERLGKARKPGRSKKAKDRNHELLWRAWSLLDRWDRYRETQFDVARLNQDACEIDELLRVKP